MPITVLEQQNFRVTKNVLKEMQRSNAFKGKMIEVFDKGYPTVQRWININDVMLTTAASLKIINDVLSIPGNEALENY